MPTHNAPRKKLNWRGKKKSFLIDHREANSMTNNHQLVDGNESALVALTKETTINKVYGPPHVLVHVGDKKANAIIDTGADRTVISQDLLEKLFECERKPILQKTAIKLKGATGHKLDIKGQIQTPAGQRHRQRGAR